jgi:hypothetical protein
MTLLLFQKVLLEYFLSLRVNSFNFHNVKSARVYHNDIWRYYQKTNLKFAAIYTKSCFAIWTRFSSGDAHGLFAARNDNDTFYKRAAEAGNFNEKLLHLIWDFQQRSPPLSVFTCKFPLHCALQLHAIIYHFNFNFTLCQLLNVKHDKNES